MKRAVSLASVLCAAALAQSSPPDLTALEQAAQKRHAEWESLAKDLNERVARILPCDPRSAAAINEVSRASEARLTALGEYLRGVSSQAFAETAAARILLNAEEKRALEVGLERADAGQEQTGVDTQADGLAQSVKQRASLEESRKVLEQIAVMIRQRVAATEQQAKAADAAVALLRDLVTKFDARDASLRDESAAFESERARWNGYYAARLARAQVECSITQAGPSSSKGPAPSKGCATQEPGAAAGEAMMMRRLALIGLLLSGAAGLIGQTGRVAYRQAYDTWRQTQANLERDAGTGGTALVSQADRSAAASSSFEATRAAYLESVAQEASQRRQILQNPGARPSLNLSPPAVAELADSELQTVTRAITRFSTDPDRGIQQLRQSLERERVALAALTEAIQSRQKTMAATSATVAALELARTRTANAFGDQATQFTRTVAQMELEGAAWAGYYEKLAEAIQVANAPPPPPRVEVTSAPPRPDTAPRIPLTRFVGAWSYPMTNGIFHGAQPEFVDLVVHEQNGHADGMFFARFRLPPGSATDPLVRFDFEGEFTATPTQRFKLVTSEGTLGTLELIPGPAFNLLEVNFQTDPQANKIRTGNFILVKK